MTSETVQNGPLSDSEVEQLRQLLKRYLSHELDQWENWKTETPYGPAYVVLTRGLPAEVLPEHFETL